MAKLNPIKPILMASKPPLTVLLLASLISLAAFVQSQQPYEGLATTDCYTPHNSTSLLGYFCNGQPLCQSYLTFHSQPPYQSAATISTLLGSDPTQLSNLNSATSTFPTNTKVIVPVNCSCSGPYYQANSSYLIQPGDTDLTIANNTYQALSTCQALRNQNSSSGVLIPGSRITVPLRCACPTTNQSSNGVRYLLSYLVDSGDTVFLISQRFGVSQQSILDANGLTSTNANIYPFTTLLIPLANPPNSSQVATPPSPPPPPPPSSPPAGTSSTHTGVYAGIGVGIGVFVLVILPSVFYIWLRARRKKTAAQVRRDDPEKVEDGKSSVLLKNVESSEEFLSTISGFGKALKVYTFEELQLATDSFSDGRRIEGSVYRGVFKGDAAAVKIMSRDISMEVDILKRSNHFNLIRLSGLCFNEGHWFLVFEYAQNGSLSNWLFDRNGSKVLSWVQRVQIALDVANGLHYLHSYTEPAYVHKDVRTSNILLDEKLRAKIANFSFARPAEGEDGEFELTRHIVGTQGYMAPEYLEHGLVSPKLDVYAFGVVMMEIVTGRGGSEISWESLFAAAKGEDGKERIQGFVDPLLDGKYPYDLALVMARLIEGCLQRDVGSRRSMEDTVQSLSKLLAVSLSWASSESTTDQSFSSEVELLDDDRTKDI